MCLGFRGGGILCLRKKPPDFGTVGTCKGSVGSCFNFSHADYWLSQLDTVTKLQYATSRVFLCRFLVARGVLRGLMEVVVYEFIDKKEIGRSLEAWGKLLFARDISLYSS